MCIIKDTIRGIIRDIVVMVTTNIIAVVVMIGGTIIPIKKNAITVMTEVITAGIIKSMAGARTAGIMITEVIATSMIAMTAVCTASRKSPTAVAGVMSAG